MSDPERHTRSPLVSIGMPVYNGQRTIEAAVRSLLDQTMPDFELVISDNASTDGTAEICGRLAEDDHRIRFVQAATNVGQAGNFDRALSLARAEFFMWAAHDDRWDPTFVERCLHALATDAGIVLVTPATSLLDAEGRSVGVDPGVSTAGLPAAARFRRYKLTLDKPSHHSTITYGLARRDALMQVMPIPRIIAWDHVINARLCFVGSFDTTPEILFFKRIRMGAGFETGAAAMGITAPASIAFTIFWREIALQRVIREAPGLSLFERVRLCAWSWATFLARNRASGVRTWLRLRQQRDAQRVDLKA